MLLVTSPENPTGAVVSPPVAARLAELATEHDLWVVSDELYEKFVYDGHVHTSLASLPGMRERTVTVQGFSKTYGLTGYRVAYLTGPTDLVRHMSKVHYATTLCASEVSQRVALAALRGPQEWLAPIVDAYGLARMILVDGLNAIDGVHCSVPDGAIYAFPDIRSFGLGSMAMTEHVIRSARVANRPGMYFGEGGEGYIRFNVPPIPTVANEVVQRVAGALDELRPVQPDRVTGPRDSRRSPLAGTWDTHVHAAPDAVPRRQDYFAIARAAREMGMVGLVFKDVGQPTVDRAYAVTRRFTGIAAIGGVVLDLPVGGLNPHAVRSVLERGGRVVWMPVVHSRRTVERYREGAVRL